MEKKLELTCTICGAKTRQALERFPILRRQVYRFGVLPATWFAVCPTCTDDEGSRQGVRTTQFLEWHLPETTARGAK